jgi:hypothetical protein
MLILRSIPFHSMSSESFAGSVRRGGEAEKSPDAVRGCIRNPLLVISLQYLQNPD